MNLAALLEELRRRDIRLSIDDDRLRCDAPAGALTPQLREHLRLRKADLLEFLRTAETIAQQPEAIVPMQPRGTHIPVYALGGHLGDVFAFRDLVRHLGDDQPFFGLQPPGVDGHGEPLERVQDLAAYFTSQIRAFQPNGPYIIAGYCAGGAVSFELARQMQQSGAQISFLALFGCPHPTFYRFRFSYWSNRIATHWRNRIATHRRMLAALPSFEERRDYVAERIRGRLQALRRQRSPARGDPASLMTFRFQQATSAALRRYAPGWFSGRVCLFIPNREWLRFGAVATRWRTSAPHTEEYYGPDTIDPDFMLLEPHVGSFAELFRQCRDAAFQRGFACSRYSFSAGSRASRECAAK